MRRDRRAIATSILATFALACGGSGKPSEGPTDVEQLRHGRLIESEALTPPPPEAPGWRPIALPDHWTRGRRARGTAGWYELPFRADGPRSEVFGVYLPAVALNAAVWVNGVPSGDGGTMTDPPARNLGRPLYFTFPGALLTRGENRLQVRLRTTASSLGMLQRIEIGPDAALRPRYALRYFAQIEVRKVLTALAFCSGGLLGLLGLLGARSRELRGAGWLAGSAVLFAVSNLDALVVEPPFPTRAWQWASQVALLGCTVCAVLAAHRAAGVRRPRLELALGACIFAVGVVHAAVPGGIVTTVAFANVAIGTLILAYLTAFVIRRRSDSKLVAVLAPLVTLALIAHDYALAVDDDVPLPFLLFPYAGAVLFVTVAAYMARGWLRALEASESLNRELERRVEEKSSELERNYGELARLEGERAIAAERSRLTRDIHDGVGSHLVTALSMIEGGGPGGPAVAHVLRDAIDDLRLVIDSIEPTETGLPTLLGILRDRLEPRLERHGVRFAWSVGDLPPLRSFGPQQALSALRIAQEAVANALKHSGARTIEVRTGVAHEQRAAFLEVRDDGKGLSETSRAGRGLGHMRNRAAALGGRLDVASDAGGTRVVLWMPLAD